jgi:hypothetical protein
MTQTILKFVISAGVIVAVSEISKRSTFIGAVFASLPLTSLLAFIWLWRDTHDTAKLATLSMSIFWLVLPSLILLIVFPVLLRRGFVFWPALGLSLLAMFAGYGAMLAVLHKFGIKL